MFIFTIYGDARKYCRWAWRWRLSFENNCNGLITPSCRGYASFNDFNIQTKEIHCCVKEPTLATQSSNIVAHLSLAQHPSPPPDLVIVVLMTSSVSPQHGFV